MFGVLALRTVGIAIDTARILEIAVVRCDATGAPLDTWARRFEPCVDAAAQDDHPRGRTPRRPDAGRPGAQIGTVLPELTARLAGLVLVAHGARVDLAVLRAELARAGWDLPWVPSLCTLEESWRHLPLLARRRLTDCCDAWGVERPDASTTGAAVATASLLARHLEADRDGPRAAEHAGLVASAATVVWPARAARPGPVTVPPPRTRCPSTRPPAERLVEILAALPLADALDAHAPDGAGPYLEIVMALLEAGVLEQRSSGDAPSAALAGVATLYDLTAEARDRVHRVLVLALLDLAVRRGELTQADRIQLATVADLLGVGHDGLVATLNGDGPCPEHAGQRRALGWATDVPLHVGDVVVVAGCSDDAAADLVELARRAGLRVAATVTRRTAALVTDGTFTGPRYAEALALGTRIVDPTTFGLLVGAISPTVGSGRAEATHPEVAPAVVRRWAAMGGFDVPPQGRLPRAAFDAFHGLDAQRSRSR